MEGERMSMDVRWRQRFENYSKSLRNLESALAIESPDIVQRAGMILFFETVFELSWKVMKDYLEEGVSGYPFSPGRHKEVF